MKSKIIPLKVVHRKKEDRAEAIADDLMKKYNGNQQEDEDGDLSELLLDSIKIAEKRKGPGLSHDLLLDEQNGLENANIS